MQKNYPILVLSFIILLSACSEQKTENIQNIWQGDIEATLAASEAFEIDTAEIKKAIKQEKDMLSYRTCKTLWGEDEEGNERDSLAILAEKEKYLKETYQKKLEEMSKAVKESIEELKLDIQKDGRLVVTANKQSSDKYRWELIKEGSELKISGLSTPDAPPVSLGSYKILEMNENILKLDDFDGFGRDLDAKNITLVLKPYNQKN